MLFPAQALCHCRLPAPWKQVSPGKSRRSPSSSRAVPKQGCSFLGTHHPHPPRAPPAHLCHHIPHPAKLLGSSLGSTSRIPCATPGMGPGSPGTGAESPRTPSATTPPLKCPAFNIPVINHTWNAEGRRRMPRAKGKAKQRQFIINDFYLLKMEANIWTDTLAAL